MAVSLTNTADGQLNFTGTTTGTITNMPIGTAAADRLVFVGIELVDGNSASAFITGVTIGGVTAAALADNVDSSGGQSVIYWAAVPTGTTANVVMTVANSSGDVFVNYSGFRAVGANTTTPVTSSSATNDAERDGAVSGSVTVGSGGALLAVSGGFIFGGPIFVGWTNATASTARDYTIGGSFRLENNTAIGTSSGSITVTADWTGTLFFNEEGVYLSLIAINAAAGDTLTNQPKGLNYSIKRSRFW